MVSTNDELKKTWYLEMLNPSELKSVNLPIDAQILKQEIPSPDLNSFFYSEVGRLWNWCDRNTWNKQDWNKWVNREELKTWVLNVRSTPAGYFELNQQGNDVEIAHFGLLPIFIGKGLGGGLLSFAIEKAWDLKIKRIWVHTCNHDHPNALNNYKARGFKVFREILQK